MGKKGSSVSLLYTIGMALAVIGFCCPMFKVIKEFNGFKFINFDNGGFTTIGALILFVGAVAGLVWAVLPMIGIKLPAAELVKTIAALALVVGIVILIVGFTQDKFYSAVAKQLLKRAMFGFYVMVAGIVLALVGRFVK